MKRPKPYWFILIVLTVISCQGKISDQIDTPETVVTTVEIESVITQETKTPIYKSTITEIPVARTTVPVAVEPTHKLTEINFVPELRGRLFVGRYDGMEYIELDFEKERAVVHEMPSFCHLLSNGQKAVCRDVSADPVKAYLYDVLLTHSDFEFEEHRVPWYLTSAETLLEYLLLKGNKWSIYAYDLEINESFYIGDFIDQDQFYLPQLSNSGSSLIGLDYQEPQLENDDRWFLMLAENSIIEPILTPENIVATDSFSWAPDDDLAALIGYYQEEGSGAEAGTLVCGRVVLIYDPIARTIIQSVKMPDQRCVTPFKVYSLHSDRYFWSPDSSMLALVLDYQDICIIDVLNKADTCWLITNNEGTDIQIRGLTWSPDSKFLALVFSDNEIRSFSLQDRQWFNIANTKDLFPFHMANILVWAQ